MSDPKSVYTTGEIADLLHIHQTTVIDWAEKGIIRSYRTPGGHRRIEREAALEFLHKHNMPVPAELEPRAKNAANPAFGEHQQPKLKK